IAKMAEEATRSGLMLQSGGLAPTAMSSRVRLSQGKLTTIDGPFMETKEVIGGFAVFEFKSREEAIESAGDFIEHYKKHRPDNEPGPGWEGEPEVGRFSGPEASPPGPKERVVPWSWRTLYRKNPIPRSHHEREERSLWTPFRPG